MLTPQRQSRIEQVARQRQTGVLVLENISDPHNAAAVLRSCDAFGFHRVCFIFSDTRFNPARVGKLTSASANKWLDISTYESTESCLDQLKNEGYTLVATALTETSESIFTTQFLEPQLALLLGNEHAGLSATAIERADRSVMIPMRGMVQSLNLSVTAAICLFEITRQRQHFSEEKYRFPPEEYRQILQNLQEKAK